MKPKSLVLAASLLIALAGCGSSNATSSGTTAPSAKVTSSAPDELGTIKESGFGQHDEYVWVTALVHNNSDYVGQTVTVNFNVLDDKGAILKSESQVESFSAPKADHIVGTQVSLASGQKAAKVEATLLVEAHGTFSDKPFPTIPVADPVIAPDQYGGFEYSFTLANPVAQPLKSPRVQVMCKDANGAINGGGATYPDLVPASGKVKVDVNLLVSGQPASCTGFIGAPMDWEGGGAAAPTAAAPASGSPEDAFHQWVDQFAAKDWAAQYKTLVRAQQSVISEADFVACRQADQPPSITWSKALGAVQVADYAIPGTSAQTPATKVSAELDAGGVKVPIDAHMIDEGGTWKWSLSGESLTKCGK